MKLQFKQQDFQTDAVHAVRDCFAGQPFQEGPRYLIDPGRMAEGDGPDLPGIETAGLANACLAIPPSQVLENLQAVQRRQGLPVSLGLITTPVCNLNFDIEMETGTGKTYCYIKTMFELQRAYGWSKFIIVVPSIAIREGVAKSLDGMAEHFLQDYGRRIRHFIYNSRQLHHLEGFSSDAGINVMIINAQAFNATGEDARRIYLEQDDFQSRRPIDVLAKNRPILILDEPQKMEGPKTVAKLKDFNPLMVLRYSATHKSDHNKVFRLDALDAFNQKLVKKIAVRGISVKGLAGTSAYLFLRGIEVSPAKAPIARLELEIRLKNRIKRESRKAVKGTNLVELSSGLDQYAGFVVAEIDARDQVVSFTNGAVLQVGKAAGDVTEAALRRIQIRETIKAHLEKERLLFAKGIKVLSLFFIDEVAKYRRYTDAGEQAGEYARVFEEEYQALLDEELDRSDGPYHGYLKGISAAQTHNGYFSIDRKTKRLKDPEIEGRGENAGESKDAEAYDLILRAQERLLSLAEPVRFLFSHSALREGWDNPNVFVICTLKHSDNTMSRRQEVGRGLRLCRNQLGERIDDAAVVHQINVLTVVANESYNDFVSGLQKDILASLSERPLKANEEYFKGKVLITEAGELKMTQQMAKLLERYLSRHDFIDAQDTITEAFHLAQKEGSLPPLPPILEPHREQIFQLVNSVFSREHLPPVEDELAMSNLTPNRNFEKREFRELWNRINHKVVYAVDFQTEELITKATRAIEQQLSVPSLLCTITTGEQKDEATYEEVSQGESFSLRETSTEVVKASSGSMVRHDLIGKLSDATQLTRKTIARILGGVHQDQFARYRFNPESFIMEVARLINEQKGTVIVEHLAYDTTTGTHEAPEIFTQRKEDVKKGLRVSKHVYDYVFTDSGGERAFAGELDASSEVVVYAKLPKTFAIPTPVGNYTPDWAIAFEARKVKHVYFVAETKGSMSSLQLKDIERSKIACAKKFFARITNDEVKFEMINSYGKLMELLK